VNRKVPIFSYDYRQLIAVYLTVLELLWIVSAPESMNVHVENGLTHFYVINF